MMSSLRQCFRLPLELQRITILSLNPDIVGVGGDGDVAPSTTLWFINEPFQVELLMYFK